MVTVLPATSSSTGSPCLLVAIGADRTAIVLGNLHDGSRQGSSPERRSARIFPRTPVGRDLPRNAGRRLLVEGGVQAGPLAGALAGLDGASLAVADEHHRADPGQLAPLHD